MKTWKKLTKKEHKHLRLVAGVNTLAGLKKSVEQQAKMRRESPDIEPCWECRAIAKKLGLPV